jgi:hypothetical protein
MGLLGGIILGIIGGVIAFKMPKLHWVVPVLVIALLSVLGYMYVPW